MKNKIEDIKSYKNEIRDWVIYKITSPSSRIYVGKTVNLSNRINQYRNLISKTQVALYASLVKYGWEAHKIEVIDKFTSNWEYANGKEIFWVRTHMSNKNKYPEQNGLNLTDGGDGQRGRRMTEENKKKLSEMHKTGTRRTNKGQKRTPEQVEANRQKAIKYWERKVASGYIMKKKPKRDPNVPPTCWNKGLSYADIYGAENLSKFGKHNIGNTYNVGKKRTGEALENIRKGVKKANSVPVIQYNLNGDIIKEFPSRIEASKETGMCGTSMNKHLKGKIKKPKRFYFRYKKSNNFTLFAFQRRVFKMVDIKQKIA